MESELRLLASYCSWQGDSSVSVLLLARSGFYYVGSGDEIECFRCKTRLIGWNGIYNPLEKHKEASPGCDAHAIGDLSRNATSDDSERLAITRTTGASGLSGANTKDKDLVQLSRNDTIASNSSALLQILNKAKARITKREVPQNNPSSQPQQVSPEFEKLRLETERFGTFYEWPHSDVVDPREMVRQGCFYTGSEDSVQCAFCQNLVYKWKLADTPAEMYKKHHPDCPFVRRMDTGNVSSVLGEETVNAIATVSKLVVGHALESGSPQFPSLGSSNNSAQSIVRQQHPKFPEYMNFIRRLESFTYGTLGAGQTADRLADAGFFYTGPGDKVMCFQCGGEFNRWRYGDDPYEVHRTRGERCPYIQTHQPSLTERAGETSLPTFQERIGNVQIQQSELDARMRTPTVSAVLNVVGLSSYELVEAVIKTKLLITGIDFPDVESLLKEIFKLMKDMSKSSVTSPRPTLLVVNRSAYDSFGLTTTSSTNTSSTDSNAQHALLNSNFRLKLSIQCTDRLSGEREEMYTGSTNPSFL